jgi:hypothetical protein
MFIHILINTYVSLCYQSGISVLSLFLAKDGSAVKNFNGGSLPIHLAAGSS